MDLVRKKNVVISAVKKSIQLNHFSVLISVFEVLNLRLSILDDFYSTEGAKTGWVGVFSLKNPAYPEYVCKADCGVMAVDVHPKHPHMLAVALSDGNVAIYNLQKSTEKPAYISTARNGKHQDIAWQVLPTGSYHPSK